MIARTNNRQARGANGGSKGEGQKGMMMEAQP
jgi:hypothetical protein